MEILYKDLSHQAIGCVFNVFPEIGPGFDEFTYLGLIAFWDKDNKKTSCRFGTCGRLDRVNIYFGKVFGIYATRKEKSSY